MDDPLSVIQRLAGGRLLDELCAALVKTAEEVVETGKQGSVTLTLKVGTRSQGDPMVIIDETIARTAPKKDPKGAYFWAVDGGLFKDDPRQPRLDFRAVDVVTGEVREAATLDAVVREAS